MGVALAYCDSGPSHHHSLLLGVRHEFTHLSSGDCAQGWSVPKMSSINWYLVIASCRLGCVCLVLHVVFSIHGWAMLPAVEGS